MSRRLWNVSIASKMLSIALFSGSVKLLFPLLAEIALVSEIVECIGDWVVCRRLWNVSIASTMLSIACGVLSKFV